MSATTPGLAPISARRRPPTASRAASLLALTLIALVPLVARRLRPAASKGLGAISWDFFTTDPTGPLPRRLRAA